MKIVIKKPNPNIHSSLHNFIDETRKEWGDTISFGQWLGFLKGVPVEALYQIRAEIKDSHARAPVRLFFWKVKEYKKKRPLSVRRTTS
jgi:hypothetical protein